MSDAMSKEINRLRAALAPFAAEAARWGDHVSDSEPYYICEDHGQPKFTIGDLRCARARLTEQESGSPQIVCCSCGRGPVVRVSPPLCLSCDPVLDREAAELWRKENPEASIFKVSLEDKIKYARRILSLATPPA